MGKYIFLLFILIQFLFFSCQDNSNSKSSQINGKLPRLDTSTSLRGKEVDGIREDVLKEIERKFKEKYKDKPGIYRALILSAWRGQRIYDIDPTNREQAKHVADLIDIASECVFQSYDDYMISYLEKKYGVKFPRVLNEDQKAELEYDKGLDEIYDADRYIESITFNTYERAKFYDKFNQSLSGTVNSDIVDRLNRAGIGACEFMERIKKEWEKTGNITKIDFYQLLEQMKKEREGQK